MKPTQTVRQVDKRKKKKRSEDSAEWLPTQTVKQIDWQTVEPFS